MPKVPLKSIVAYCDQLLRISEIKDFTGAVNGLQMENSGSVSRIIATVDASVPTIKRAITAKADLLIVHHGLFWNERHPWTGVNYELQRLLIENDLAIYSSHLPLDFHPKLGNNALLCALLGFRKVKPFLFAHGQPLGFQVQTKISRAELAKRLGRATDAPVKVIAGGPAICQRIGVVTGGAGQELKQAAAEGVDTYITGEGPHWTYAMAEELGVNVLYGGHYATETFGVRALASHLSKKFHVPWAFLDHPTGL
ncbi:MAG TPA: Nif3-like dinuclear metal center hexameric protein [Verrucomicrobiae bacterium]|jgi:dinuclear metal center YbgI/SA1388 family protein